MEAMMMVTLKLLTRNEPATETIPRMPVAKPK